MGVKGDSLPGGHNSRTIRPINNGVVHRICAGQVILDLSSAVKELVENSLDAGATSIEISLREYGEDSFQVIDNGCGISPHNFKVLALKHHTSKLSDFPDLQSLTTFGFRGEALSSLCALGELTVETRTKNETVATHLTYDRSGLLVDESKTARQIGTTVTVKKLFSSLPVRSKEFHRNIRKEYGKLITLLNAYALIARGVRLVCTNTIGRNVKSVVLKTQGTGSLKDNIITVFGMSTFTCLEPVGVCISDGCAVDGFLSKPGYGSGRNLGDRQFFFVNGRPVDMPKVTKLVNELYRGANSRQYPIAIMNFSVPTGSCDVNVTPDKRKIFFSDEGSILRSLRDALEKIYSPNHASFSVNKFEESHKDKHKSKICAQQERYQPPIKQSPQCSNGNGEACVRAQYSDRVTILTKEREDIKDFAALEINNINLNSSTKDFMLKIHGSKKDDSICGSSSDKLKKDDSISRSSSDKLENLGGATMDQHLPLNVGSVVKDSNTDASSSSFLNVVQTSLDKFVTQNKRKHESVGIALSEVPLLRNGPARCQSSDHKFAKHSSLSKSSIISIAVDHSVEVEDDDPGPSNVLRGNTVSGKTDMVFSCAADVQKGESKELGGEETFPVSISNNLEIMSEVLPEADTTLQSSGPSSDYHTISGLKVGSTLHFSFKELITRRQRLARLRSSNHVSGQSRVIGSYSAATLELSQSVNEEGKERALAAATSELERLFKKEDFGRMKVIGQFNLGFIVGKLDYDLFIVDQHAADEKYNYERLSRSTVLNQQPLFQAMTMELSPEEEIVVSMHMDILRKNGFSLEDDVCAPPGQRFKLKAVPFSKNTTFGVSDVKELLAILADSHGECSTIGSYRTDTADSVCPPRVRAMLASRACRSSVMIGDPLGRNEMQKILEHLVDLKSPWNCPHGRPTMRHLVDLRTVYKRVDEGGTAL